MLRRFEIVDCVSDKRGENPHVALSLKSLQDGSVYVIEATAPPNIEAVDLLCAVDAFKSKLADSLFSVGVKAD